MAGPDWSLQIQKAWSRKILGSHVRRVSSCDDLRTWTRSLFWQQSRFRVTSLTSKQEKDVILKNARTCGGTADVLIAVRDSLFFNKSRGT